MNEEQLLASTVGDTLETLANRACDHYDSDNLADACAIINEWTTDDGDSILTHFYMESLHKVRGDIMYMFNDGKDIGYGTFSFTDSGQELPIDQWN